MLVARCQEDIAKLFRRSADLDFPNRATSGYVSEHCAITSRRWAEYSRFRRCFPKEALSLSAASETMKINPTLFRCEQKRVEPLRLLSGESSYKGASREFGQTTLEGGW